MNPKQAVQKLVDNDSTIKSIAELERKLNISNGTINKWDKSQPTIKVLEKLANYFNVSVDYILGREKEQTRDLSHLLEGAMSFDGKPMSENDKKVILAFLEGKFSDK